MSIGDRSLTREEKRALARRLLAQRRAAAPVVAVDPLEQTYDQFMTSTATEPEEMRRFQAWVDAAQARGIYAFERPRAGAQRPEIELTDETGAVHRCVNLSSYNYLGFGTHPEVIAAAKEALDRYGLGAASSPVAGGTLELHRALEAELVEFLGVPDRAATLFSSGYGVNTGTISAFLKPGQRAVLDQHAHMSIVEGAHLAGARIDTFAHNDADDLARVLDAVPAGTRTLVCVEGAYSADGDFGRLAEIVEVAKRRRAHVLVDEAHSVLLAGPNGRGVCEAAGVLDDVDLYVLTFSKALGGVGGAVVARREIITYINWYARCRMFSCAIDPAVTGGVRKALELARGDEGALRRRRLLSNAAHLRARLRAGLDIGVSESWIVPVIYGPERRTLPMAAWLNEAGVDGSVMQFPAVPRNASRIRLFVTSEHTHEQLDRAAEVLLEAGRRFGFHRGAPAAEAP